MGKSTSVYDTFTVATVLGGDAQIDFSNYTWAKPVCTKKLLFGYIADKLKGTGEVSSVLISSTGSYIHVYASLFSGTVYTIVIYRDSFSSAYMNQYKSAREYMEHFLKGDCAVILNDNNVGYVLI